MKNILYILLLFCLTIVGCSKDYDGEFELDEDKLFVRDYGESGQITFTSQDLSEYEVSSAPDGWEVVVSASDKTITVTAPNEDDEEIEVAGTVYIYGYTPDDDSVYVYFSVGIADKIALDDPSNDQQANCMIVTQPNTVYTFNPNRRGESTTEVSEKAVDCEVVWRTSGSPISFVEMTDDGDITFYTKPSWDDDVMELTEGNVVIAALSDSEEVLWSWHIWVTETPVEDVEVAGMTFLDRNLGAFMNDNSDDDNILDSYGLYYQWGRKDPFIYANTYNASGSTDAYLYDDDGYYFTMSQQESNAVYGQWIFSRLSPATFVTGDPELDGDWLYGSDKNDYLWGTNGEKSIYDPSPKGYRVPTSAEYAQLTLNEEEELTLESYGRTLDGELFMAYGVRTYLDYTIQNYKADGSYARWAGYYWSCDANEAESDALYFDSDGNIGVTTSKRATGMQIRSIKME
ncbi:MAG: hypothetical protein R3Y39_08645 [Rikenellaceae bacterium]